ncbi:peroxiredoxin [Tepidamorphus sp. 3E244]|uniref:peroxiredoxin n=1 Tax=Tepidamorphus sp. 3E244 TaxID=3385498 RepID=UPI0038FC8667
MATSLDLPEGLPVPEDDGGAQHLAGMAMPRVELPTTSGSIVDVAKFPGRTVLYVYPMTGRPDQALPTGWDDIPGARGCTPQSCGFRDHFEDLKALGVSQVYGLSTQDSAYQQEARDRLHLPFDLISDEHFKLGDIMRLPHFEVDGRRLFKRMALILDGARIRHVFYPVFPPDRNADDVIAWLEANPA